MNQNELAHQITDLAEGRIDAVINWRDTCLEMPAESGYYLILLHTGTIMHVPYSAELKAFNVRDGYTDADRDNLEIKPKCWARTEYRPEY